MLKHASGMTGTQGQHDETLPQLALGPGSRAGTHATPPSEHLGPRLAGMTFLL